MNNTCRDCKWWKRSYDTYEPYNKHNIHICDCEGCQGPNELNSFNVMWNVLDDSGLQIVLQTGSEFSCCHFSSRNTMTG